MRTYIADCRGWSTGEFTAASDSAAWTRAKEWARETFSLATTPSSILECWDKDADTLVRSAYLNDVIAGRI